MRRSSIVILTVVLLVLIIAGFFLTNPKARNQLLVDLDLATPEAQGYTASGILEAQMVYVATEMGGRVEALLVDEGQQVQQSEVIAQLDVSLMEVERDVSKARLAGAQAFLEMLLGGARDVDIAVVQARLDQSKAILESALQALEDAAASYPKRLRDERIDIAQAQVDQAQAGVDASEAVLMALEEGATEVDIAVARATVDAAKAQLAGLEDRIERGEIRAPIDGVLLEHLILPGELALPGMPVVILADLSQVELTVYLPEADLGWVQVGDTVTVRVDAYPERTFRGEVVQIADKAEFTPRNVQTPEERVILVYAVRILIPNLDGTFKPGLPADVTFGAGR